jgi:hypothetical protein
MAMTKMQITVGGQYIRKRDKMLVRVEKLSRSNVTYCTLPMLILWNTTAESFRKGFRPATKEELDNE